MNQIYEEERPDEEFPNANNCRNHYMTSQSPQIHEREKTKAIYPIFKLLILSIPQMSRVLWILISICLISHNLVYHF